MFEIATKNKYRFPFRGQISVEDLWDLNTEQLDTVFKALSREKKDSEEPSLVDAKKTDNVLETKIAIVKHIFSVKEEERMANKRRAEAMARQQRLRDLIADKEDEELKNMSIDDLQSMLNSIE